MNLKLTSLASVFGMLLSHSALTEGVHWVPESLLPPPPPAGTPLAGYLSVEQGQAILEAALKQFPNPESWDAYAKHARQRIQEGAGLSPWPKRTPLNPVVRNRRTYDGYTVENVILESVPGHFITGNLYRPLNPTGPCPVFLSTHGHSKGVKSPEDYDDHARFAPGMQARCGTLARMGVIVLSLDMFAHGDSIQVFGYAAHKNPAALTIQLWNAIRAVDYLLSLEGVDPKRVGVSGESGGGTQSFLLTALDSRVTLSVPVVMVSSYFFGGCFCESALPIHRSADHFVNNAMIAALAAPRPQLVISDGKDWTKDVPRVEFPFLQQIYSYYGEEKEISNVHLADEGHDYGPSKRAAMITFVGEKFGLDLRLAKDASGAIDESKVTIEHADQLHVFDSKFPIPAHALHDAKSVADVIRKLQE
ncbi:MAG: acetylxylan esterase [Verrucomicrobiota bacterium]